VWWLIPCNPRYSGGRNWEELARDQPGQKVRETLSQPMAWCGGVHLSSQLYGEAQIGGSHPGIKQDPSEKYLKLKEWQSGSNGRALT
jgi:hypothetical protein